jgi:nickel-dependent lactate racemase
VAQIASQTKWYREPVIVKLPFADDRLALDLRGFRVRALTSSAPPGRNAAALAANALDAPLSGHGLEDVARGRSSAAVVVPDATRKASLSEVLPVVLERLRRAGIGGTSIVVVIANGTHPRVGPQAVASLVGPIDPAIEVIEHDSRASDLVEVGELRPGVPLRLHPVVVESDCLVTVGTVRHHYFAGFGGGPKMVFPGVGGYEEIQANHGLVLDLNEGRKGRHPRCEPGVLEGNPVAEEIIRAAELRPPDFALCLVEGREGGVAWAAAGPWQAAFHAAIEKVRGWFEVTEKEPFALMVVSAGGRPTDSTLIQAHKSIDAACRFLQPGGELLWISALDEGLGSEEMRPFVENPRPDEIIDKLKSGWVQYGHTTLRIVDKTSRFLIHLHSTLDREVSDRLGFYRVADPDAVLGDWRARYPGAQVGVLAGAAVYPSGRFES